MSKPYPENQPLTGRQQAIRRYYDKNRETILAKAAERYRKHHERIRAQQRLAYWANPDAARTRAKASAKQYRQRHPERVRAALRLWQRNNREHIYAYLKAYQPGYHAANPEKVRRWASNRNRRWSQRHPELKLADNRRRRARIMHAPVNDLTPEQWQHILTAFRHCCAYCGRKMKQLTQDHVTSYYYGGSNTLWNVVPACRSCNSKKGAKGPLCPVQPLLL